MKLFQDQQRGVDGVNNAWASGARNVIYIAPTGSGKTVVMSHVIKQLAVPTCAIAHRQELVTQISRALARNEVQHRIIAPRDVIKFCARTHVEETGRSWFHPEARTAVAGVDTLVKRGATMGEWARTVGLWVMDEAHHVLRENKWGKAVEMFPLAKGLGVTATPERADGKGLGAHSDGHFEEMVQGPTMRELIRAGRLTDYKIIAPPPQIHMDADDVGSTGDYKQSATVKKFRANKSKIIGDVVMHYLKHAPGRLGVTFVPDVLDAQETAEAYRLAGVPAVVIHAKTPQHEREHALRAFARRELLQLVNVDLFGEGFDLPAVEVVTMARPTQSFALFVQQAGRALRKMDGKDRALIIDHVGNVARHAAAVQYPDGSMHVELCHRDWTLDAREKRSRSGKDDDAMPVKTCSDPTCLSVYEAFLPKCPYCGHKPVPVGRARPEQVDGDLTELDAATLALMRGEISRVDMSPEAYQEELAAKGCPQIGQIANVKRHVSRQSAQYILRDTIAQWAGYQRAAGRGDSESYRLFFHKFKTDVLSAQTLGADDARQLTKKIEADYA